MCEDKEGLFRGMLSKLSVLDIDATAATTDGADVTTTASANDAIAAPLITYLTEYKSVKDLIEATVEYSELQASYEVMNALDVAYDKADSGGGPGGLITSAGRSRAKSARGVFDAYIGTLELEYRADKALIKNTLADANCKITYSSNAADLLQVLRDAASSSLAAAGDLSPLHELMSRREYVVRNYITGTIDILVEDREDELKEAKKLETRYIELLEDYYYRSDHVGISWEEAKDDLYRRSAYASGLLEGDCSMSIWMPWPRNSPRRNDHYPVLMLPPPPLPLLPLFLEVIAPAPILLRTMTAWGNTENIKRAKKRRNRKR